MRNKIISVVVIVMTALLFCACLSKNGDTTKEEIETISVTTAPPCTSGTVKIYSDIYGVLFDGYGEIKIKNSGWNGQQIEIEMYIEENDENGE